MSHHQIWHAFYFNRTGSFAAPCRSEVIEANNEEAAARVARGHLHAGERVTLEAAPWMHQTSRTIYGVPEEPSRRPYLH